MKKIILLTALIFFIISCNIKKESIIGSYRVCKSNYFQRCINYLTNTHRILGVNLELNQDSTFAIKTCSYYAIGNWKVKENHLILNYKSKKIFVDSLNDYQETIDSRKPSNKHEEFTIRKNSLIQFDKNENENFVLIMKKPNL